MNITPRQLRRQVDTAIARGYLRHYVAAAERYGFTEALLLAKDSRESCLGQCLDATFRGDNGNAWGLSQIDQRYHTAFTSSHSPRDHAAVIDYGAWLLRQDTDALGSVRRGLVAYNAGRDNVREALANGVDIDTYTTGGDYSRDVLDRFNVIRSMYPELAQKSGGTLAGPGAIAAILMGGGILYLLAANLFDLPR